MRFIALAALLLTFACGDTHPADNYCDTACSKASVCFNLSIGDQHDCYDACIDGVDNMAAQCDWSDEDTQAFSDESTGALRRLTCAAFAEVLYVLRDGGGGACP